MSWNSFQQKNLINNRVRKTGEEITLLNLEYKGLKQYKDKVPISLTRLYLDLLNNIKEISNYSNAVSIIKISGANEGTDIEQFFKTSAYKGIRYVDVLCEVNFKDELDMHFLPMFYEMIKLKPISLLEVGLDKDRLILTMRLYGL